MQTGSEPTKGGREAAVPLLGADAPKPRAQDSLLLPSFEDTRSGLLLVLLVLDLGRASGSCCARVGSRPNGTSGGSGVPLCVCTQCVNSWAHPGVQSRPALSRPEGRNSSLCFRHLVAPLWLQDGATSAGGLRLWADSLGVQAPCKCVNAARRRPLTVVRAAEVSARRGGGVEAVSG